MKPVNRDDGKRVKLPKNQHKSKKSISKKKMKKIIRQRKADRWQIIKNN